MSDKLTAEELAELKTDVRSCRPNWTMPMRAEKVAKLLAAAERAERLERALERVFELSVTGSAMYEIARTALEAEKQ